MRRRLPRKFYNQMKNHMRRLTMRSPVLRELKLQGRLRKVVGTFKNGKHKFKYFHVCAACGAHVEHYEADHIKEVSSVVINIDKQTVELDFGEWMDAMFPELKDLQKLCEGCHLLKTNQFVKTLRPGSLL